MLKRLANPNELEFNYVALLKACTRNKDLCNGSKIHADVEKKGLLERSNYLTTTLINMYAKCGATEKARQVLEEFSSSDIASWNALIAGYAQEGRCHEAMDCFERMRNKGLSQNSITFICILKSCGKARDVKNGKRFHSEIVCRRLLEKDVVLGTTLVDMYAKCGLFKKAEEVMGDLTEQNAISWNALISEYVEQGKCHEALSCFERMQSEGLAPDVVTLVCVLKACGKSGAITKGQDIHHDIESRGLLDKEIMIGNALMDMYVKCGVPVKAQEVFYELLNRDVVSWNVLIAGYSGQQESRKAFNCLERMQSEGLLPNVVTYICIFKACGITRSLEKGKQNHSKVVSSGFLEKQLDIGKALFDMYVKCGALDRAHEVLEEHLSQDNVSWNTLLAGYAHQKQTVHALNCFKRMQTEGHFPDLITFMCILKACGIAGVIHKVSCLYDELRSIESGELKGKQEKETIIRNYKEELVAILKSYPKDTCEVYTNAGSFEKKAYIKREVLSETKQKLNLLPVGNAGSWNALILSYARDDQGQDALHCFDLMQREGLYPNEVTLTSLLQACGTLGDIEKGKEIHREILTRGLLEKDLVLGTAIIDMYSKCGMLSIAQQVLEELAIRDTISWSALIAGYAQGGQFHEALNCFERMQCEGLTPDAITLTCILKSCGCIRAIEKGEQIHGEIVSRALLEKDVLLGNSLVDMYVKCGMVEKAKWITEELPIRNISTWSTLISGYVQQGQAHEALNCFGCIQSENIPPDIATFICILNACGQIGALEKGIEIDREISDRGLLENDVILGAALVDMYTKCGDLARAHRALLDIPMRDVVCWSTLICGYAQMEEGDHSLTCFAQMQSEGLIPDAITFSCILKACGSTGAVEKGKQVHNKIENMGLLERDIVLQTALVDMYAKCNALAKAQEMLERFRVYHVAPCNALLSAYVQQDQCQNALICFEQMQTKGLSPDVVTFICILKACTSIGALAKGKQIHDEIANRGMLIKDIALGTVLVDMYAKCGMLTKAHQVLEELPVRNIVSWNIVIAEYGQQGKYNEVLSCFQQLQNEGLSPDGVTFLCALNACNHSGNVDSAQILFHHMTRKYGITPSIEHFTCMVTILANVRLFKQAVSVMQVMPSSEFPQVWLALLGACRKWGNVDIGRLAFHQLIQLDANIASAYILMANIFAAAGMSADAKKIEVMWLNYACK